MSFQTDAINVSNLSKSYTDFSLSDVSFCLPKGYILGLIGQNGAGKTTIIKLILNTIKQAKGTISIFGINNNDRSFTDVKQDIGFVFDQANFPLVLTPNNINAIMKRVYKNWSCEQFFEYLKNFNLPAKKQFKDFSKGMRMKLSIAVALSHGAKLLILDEATSGLDPVAREEILDILNEFTRNEDHSVLISSHITSDLEKICDYIVFIKDGKLIFCEQKDILLEKYSLLKLNHDEFLSVPSSAIVAKFEKVYGFDLLVQKNLVSSAFRSEHFSLEDLILFLSKEGSK